MNGILNVYKEPGFTSFDVVAKLRGILKQKKIGHTGTLDPMAEGVLVVCLGNATKLCDLITNHDKIYEAELLLGRTTDTEDVTGTTLSENDVERTETQIRETILSFEGEYDQVPPMYSAIRVDGKHLYELARAGKEIERAARKVHIDAIKILEVKLPVVRMQIACSKGTYIRALCRDIGERLGCGGCMKSLLRRKVGDFDLTTAHRLSEIQTQFESGNLSEWMLSCDSVFQEFSRYELNAEQARLAINGNPLKLSKEAERIRVYLPGGEFLALYRYDEQKDLYVVEKMFL